MLYYSKYVPVHVYPYRSTRLETNVRWKAKVMDHGDNLDQMAVRLKF